MKKTFHYPTWGRSVLSIGVSITCIALLASCGSSDPDGARLPGYLECDWIVVSSPRSGELTTRPVRKGNLVNKGDLLAQLDGVIEKAQLAEISARVEAARHRLADAQQGERPENLAVIEAQVAEATAAFSYAKAEYERTRKLFNEAAISERELNRASSEHARSQEALRTLENRLAAARIGQRPGTIESLSAEIEALLQTQSALEWHLKQTTVICPEDGWIQDTYAEPGEWIGTGKPMFMIRPKGRLYARFYVPDHLLQQFETGTAIRLHVSGEQKPIEAEVRYRSTQPEHTPPVLYSRTSQDSLVFMVEALLAPNDADRLHPGTPVEVEIKPLRQPARI